jgi:hypothetical protein
MFTLVFPVGRVTLTVPALEPAKVLNSKTAVLTRRRSSRAPRAAASAAATGEPPHGTTVATGPQQGVVVVVAATTATVAATSASPAFAPTTGDCAAVVDVPDDDAPPPGWAQWENWPAPAPELAAGVLVMWEDGYVMPGRPTHGVEASSSHVVLPAPDVIVTPPE